MSRDVHVTGIGIVSPAGLTAEETWQSLLAGARCISPAPELSEQLGLSVVAGQVRGFCPPAGFETRDRVCQMAVAAALEAIGGNPDAFRASLGNLRLGISVGTSKGGIQHFGRFAAALYRTGKRPLLSDLPSATDIPPDSAARAIAELLAAPAIVHATVGACTTGTLAVIRGAQLIQDGEADVVICGGADASLHPLWFAAFEQMRALAPPHPELGPAYACQPFDRGRRGFAVGEGAGMLLLESDDALASRRSRAIAHVAGHAVCTDPAGLTQLTESGEILAHAIRLACSRAGIKPEELVCLHAHGTGTIANDLAEARALTSVMGDRLQEIPIVSAKGTIGHLLGAAGAVELALACCCQHQCFGNTTLIHLDPALGRCFFPKEKFDVQRGRFLKTSMGFGGHVAAVIVSPAERLAAASALKLVQ